MELFIHILVCIGFITLVGCVIQYLMLFMIGYDTDSASFYETKRNYKIAWIPFIVNPFILKKIWMHCYMEMVDDNTKFKSFWDKLK